jgi:hypothetical protein
MAKKPFYRAFDDWWYVQLDANGKRTQKKLVKGKANEAEAFQAFYRLMADGPDLPPPRTLTAAKCCDLFLNHSQKHNTPQTYGWYKGYLQSFCDLFGSVPALDLKPFHVTRWLDQNPGWQGSRRSAIAAIKRAFNWCEDEGVLPHSPLKRVKKPPQTCRERVLTPAERQTVLTGIKDRPFQEFLFALLETGCRPGEARTVCGHHVNLELGAWVFPPKEHKTGNKTGKPRVIYLSPAMLTLRAYCCCAFRLHRQMRVVTMSGVRDTELSATDLLANRMESLSPPRGGENGRPTCPDSAHRPGTCRSPGRRPLRRQEPDSVQSQLHRILGNTNHHDLGMCQPPNADQIETLPFGASIAERSLAASSRCMSEGRRQSLADIAENALRQFPKGRAQLQCRLTHHTAARCR